MLFLFMTLTHYVLTEKGQFLALDLGGTNCRTLLVTLTGNKQERPRMTECSCTIPQEIMTGSSTNVRLAFTKCQHNIFTQLFTYIANTLCDFLTRHGLDREKLPLGFTFSFPCVQQALNRAFLVRWTKGFNIEDAVDKNVCHLLQTAIDEAVSSPAHKTINLTLLIGA